MHILITNDDGVSAPGLLALAQAMRQFGQVSIVAPDHDWSGYSHTKHYKRPLRIEEVRLTDGTTDIGAIALGYASITPLKLDYTDYRKTPDLAD